MDVPWWLMWGKAMKNWHADSEDSVSTPDKRTFSRLFMVFAVLAGFPHSENVPLVRLRGPLTEIGVFLCD